MPAVVNTELGSGLVESRGVKVSQPEDVADEIVRALEYPKFDVFVPRGRLAKSCSCSRVAPARRSPGR